MSNILLKPGSLARPDQVAQGIIQPGLKYLQRQRPDNLSVAMYDCPCGEKIFFISSLNLLFQCMPIVSHSLPHTTVMSLALLPCRPPCKYRKAAVRSPQSLSFCRLSKPHSLTLFSQSLVSSPNRFGDLCRTPVH